MRAHHRVKIARHHDSSGSLSVRSSKALELRLLELRSRPLLKWNGDVSGHGVAAARLNLRDCRLVADIENLSSAQVLIKLPEVPQDSELPRKRFVLVRINCMAKQLVLFSFLE